VVAAAGAAAGAAAARLPAIASLFDLKPREERRPHPAWLILLPFLLAGLVILAPPSPAQRHRRSGGSGRCCW